ncbi:MAG TPA: glutathione S-transferase family protein [Xanthobacteraceae bacterium]|nr:glutathione S-transferase family protein [Xanthobacteraceae bacterium]
MPELELIGTAPSNYVWTCRIALAEKGVPYRLNELRPHCPEVDAIHPFGKIPVMRHGAVELCESRAICSYIDNVFDGPKLAPSDPIRAAQVEQWVSIVNTHIDPVWVRQYLVAHFFPGTPDGSPEREKIAAALPKMEQQFASMDRAVAKTSHLVGDSFTLADMNFMPILYYMGLKPESSALLQRSPSLKAYFDRHMARKSVQETVPSWIPGQKASERAA